jgi:hypothetical protein
VHLLWREAVVGDGGEGVRTLLLARGDGRGRRHVADTGEDAQLVLDSEAVGRRQQSRRSCWPAETGEDE